MYEEFHNGASVLVGRFCDGGALSTLPPKHLFAWLHRFYLVLDGMATRHGVFKLNGGAEGFLLAANVAEPDANHAATLFDFAQRLTRTMQHIRVPGGARLDLSLALDSGPLASGLLGKTSLTYQVVGRCVSVARELAERQSRGGFLVADGMFHSLPVAAACLAPLGGTQLLCCPEAAVPIYTLPLCAAPPPHHAAPAAPLAAALPVAKAGPVTPSCAESGGPCCQAR